MNTKTKLFKIILLCVVIAIAAGVTAYLIPVIKDLATEARTTSI